MHRTAARLSAFAARTSGDGAAWWRAGSSQRRALHASLRRDIVKPFLLADIGEGIKEVQIIQWFVQPGARVEQFDKICEVQSDKASVDITSRFDGVIKKLHYEPDAMAQVGKPLLDIDITGDISPSDEKLLDDSGSGGDSNGSSSAVSSSTSSSAPITSSEPKSTADKPASTPPSSSISSTSTARSSSETKSSTSNLATPAVRGLLKEKNLDITDIQGTGKDGRVLKEDVHAHVAAQKSGSNHPADASSSAPSMPSFSRPATAAGPQQETPVALSGMQNAMFKSMTKSLAIPHFLCADEVDLTALTALRQQLNIYSPDQKLSALAFIIKAVSLTLDQFPLLNSRLDIATTESSAKIVYRTQHNIGVAMDTPQGLLVPNIKSVNSLSIREIGRELSRLQTLASRGKLTSADLRGGTITVSNIGSIGGTYATPLLIEGEVAILATGRAKKTPRFIERKESDARTGELRVEARDVAAFSWSADHRVLDGATVARAGNALKQLLEAPGRMVVELR